jgi:hypothetical protein
VGRTNNSNTTDNNTDISHWNTTSKYTIHIPLSEHNGGCRFKFCTANELVKIGVLNSWYVVEIGRYLFGKGDI